MLNKSSNPTSQKGLNDQSSLDQSPPPILDLPFLSSAPFTVPAAARAKEFSGMAVPVIAWFVVNGPSGLRTFVLSRSPQHTCLEGEVTLRRTQDHMEK